MVVATPSVPAGTIYLDSYDGSAQWETFLMKEFLPYLRRRFHAGRRAQDDDGHGHFDGRARRAASCFQIPRNLRRGGRDGTRRLAGALLGRDARSEQNPPRRKPRQSFRRPLRRVALAGRQSGVDRRRRPRAAERPGHLFRVRRRRRLGLSGRQRVPAPHALAPAHSARIPLGALGRPHRRLPGGNGH